MDTIPPDPYKALGVARDATSGVIKTAYRKLALTCHPDKVEGKGDEFYRIQQAYEILGDDTRRQQYDDETRLAELRRDLFSRKGSGSMPHVEIRTASFDIRTPNGSSFQARGPTRMSEERRHSATKTSYDDVNYDDYFGIKTGSRKYDGRPQPRPSRPGESGADVKLDKNALRDRERAEREKHRVRVQRQDRGRKYASVADEDEGEDSSNSDEKGRHEEARRHYNESEKQRYEKTKKEQHTSDDDRRSSYEKLQSQDSERKQYISRSKESTAPAHSERLSSPPPPSSYPRGPDPYDVRKGAPLERPGLLRRNSTSRPVVVEVPPRPMRRESVSRRSPEHDLPSHPVSARRPPPLTTTQSSPSNFKVPSPVDDHPRRTRTEYLDRAPPHPHLQRAETMPLHSSSASRSAPRPRDTPTTPAVSSNLRHSETNDSGYSTSSSGDTPQPQSWGFSQPPPTSFKQSKHYHYGEPTTMVEEPLGNGSVEYGTNGRPSTTIRQPSRSRHRSPSPPRERTSAKNPLLTRSASHMHHSTISSADRAPSRERSKTTTTGSVRRPGLQRSDSSHVSSRGMPTLARNNVPPPPPLKTPSMVSGTFIPGVAVGSNTQYFDDPGHMRSASPQEMYSRVVPEVVRPSRKTAAPSREDSGHGPETMRDADFAAPKVGSVRRAHTMDSVGGLGRTSTVREAREVRGERDPREKERVRGDPRERPRERDKERESSGRDREREHDHEREREYARERVGDRVRAAPPRRGVTTY